MRGLLKLLRTVTGAALGLLLVESLAFFNLVDFRKSTWLADTHFDEALISVHRPYTRESGSATSGAFSAIYKIPPADVSRYQWDLRYDRNGFRNEADWKHADIVVVGSSYVEGITIPTSELMTTLLSQQTGTVVENLGHNAYGPQQELLSLRRYGLPLHPKIVIWTYTDYIELQQEMIYRSETHYGSNRWSRFVDRSFTRQLYTKVSHTLTAMTQQVEQAMAPDDAQVIRRSGVVRDSHGIPRRIYFLHPAEPLRREELSALKRTADTIRAANRLCEMQGARLVVVFIPDQFRVFHGLAQFDPRSECVHWVVNEQPQLLEKAVESISPDIGYLDLTPFLVSAAKRGIVPYFTDDNHWSPPGHKIAAGALSQYLLHRGGLETTPALRSALVR